MTEVEERPRSESLKFVGNPHTPLDYGNRLMAVDFLGYDALP